MVWRRSEYPGKNCHWRWDMGASLWSGEQKTKHGMEESLLSSEEEIQNTAFRQENRVNALLGHAWTYSGAFPPHGQTVNSANYCAMLRNELKPAICKKRRWMLSKKVLLHHDNAHPHTAAATVQTVQQLGFELLQHPPYSPDLSPSDYHIFGPLKEALRGRRFASDEEVKEAVHTWLWEQPKSFFSAGIRKLVELI